MEISDEAADTLRGVMQSYLSAFGYEFHETFERDKALKRAWEEIHPKEAETVESWVLRNCKFAAGKVLLNQLMALRGKMAMAAQAAYDAWSPEGDDGDVEVGHGGICDEIAREIEGIIAAEIEGVELDAYGQEGDDHAAVVARLGSEAYVIDIPYWLYESGGGYSWKKKLGINFSAENVEIVAL
jgi:hypothetical protein